MITSNISESFSATCSCDNNINYETVGVKTNNQVNEILKLDTNKCSKKCCSYTQWKLPEELNQSFEPNIIPNNISCNGNTSGCLCMTKDNFNYFANRGSSKI